MIDIDGSLESGSGTIVRDAVGFAILTRRSLHLTNIRYRREKPGLRPQHLKALKASEALCGGRLEGGRVGSKEIVFHPGPTIKGGSFTWDIGTAGSTTMLVSTLLPLALFAERGSTHTVIGGLFQDFAPSAFHMLHVLLPTLRAMGAETQLEILQPGYVPRGQGRVRFSATPLRGPLRPWERTDPGEVRKISGVSLASRLAEREVAARMARECRGELKKSGFDIDLQVVEDEPASPAFEKPAVQPGAALAIWAHTSGGCILGADMAGARRRTSERIGRATARELVEDLESKASVDRHLADQVIPFAALAKGTSRFRIPRMTDHVASRLWLVKEMLGAGFRVEGETVVIRGIGRDVATDSSP
jgi:RNA 3'-terminal phosphate cyclase (ATP)